MLLILLTLIEFRILKQIISSFWELLKGTQDLWSDGATVKLYLSEART